MIIEGMNLIDDTADAFTADIDRRFNRIFACSRFKQSQLNNHYALWFHGETFTLPKQPKWWKVNTVFKCIFFMTHESFYIRIYICPLFPCYDYYPYEMYWFNLQVLTFTTYATRCDLYSSIHLCWKDKIIRLIEKKQNVS